MPGIQPERRPTIVLTTAMAVIMLSGSVFPSYVGGQDPYRLPHIMHQDPEFVSLPRKVVFSESLLPLWLKALNSNSTELQRKAAETIPLAVRRGMPGLEAAAKPLLDKLSQSDLDPLVRLAVVKALVAIDARQSAGTLTELHVATSDLKLHHLIEHALIDWKDSGLTEIWHQRIRSAVSGERVERLSLVLAMRGVAATIDQESIELLARVLENSGQGLPVRYQAARSIGVLADNGFEEFAKSRIGNKQLAERLLGVSVIANHPSETGHPILLQYSRDPEPAVAHVAWSSLLASDSPRELDSSVDFGLTNPDYKIRSQSLRLLRLWQNPSAIEKTGTLLSDPHPDVRNLARKFCLECAVAQDNDKKDGSTLKGSVISAAMKALDTNWQGMQQGLLVLAELDHKPAVDRSLELLDHPRPEVHITAGWTLERLSVASTFEPILQRLEKQVTEIKSGGSSKYSESQYESIAHLIQLLGKNKYAGMEKVVIEKLIAKDMSLLAYPIRPAAIWSISQIYQGKKLSEGLSSRLLERLLDDDAMNPEDENVKAMVAITFARTNDQSKLESIRNYAELSTQNKRLGFCCYWAIHQLNGEPIPKPSVYDRPDTNWFLVPIQ